MKLPLARGRHRKAARTVAGALSVGAFVAWLGFFYLFLRYDSTRPSLPGASTGRVYAQNNHGHVVYLTKHERCKRNEVALVALCLLGTALVVHVLLVGPLNEKESWEIKRW
jgi:multisubunit Na+/H+ antiporter MnhB subunit